MGLFLYLIFEHPLKHLIPVFSYDLHHYALAGWIAYGLLCGNKNAIYGLEFNLGSLRKDPMLWLKGKDKENQDKWQNISDRERLVLLSFVFQKGSNDAIVTDEDVIKVSGLAKDDYYETKKQLRKKGLMEKMQDCWGLKLTCSLYPTRRPQPHYGDW